METWASRWSLRVPSSASEDSKPSSSPSKLPPDLTGSSRSASSGSGPARRRRARRRHTYCHARPGPGPRLWRNPRGPGDSSARSDAGFGGDDFALGLAARLSSRSSSGFFSSSVSQYSASSMFDNCSSLIACCNCGVITRDWPCRISNLCPSPPCDRSHPIARISRPDRRGAHRGR